MRIGWVIIFFLILSCLPRGVSGQGQITDTSSLDKYTYLIYGKTRSACVVQATGFLVKKNNQVYLVTACHVINGWRFESFEKEDSYPDTLFLRVNLKNTDSSTFVPIDISKIKNIKSKADWPDVYFYKLNLSSQFKIYTLDDLIHQKEEATRVPTEVLIYGFQIGDVDFERSKFLRLKPQKAIAHFPDKDAYACSPIVYDVGYAGNTLGPGNSGSPVYFIYESHANVRKQIKLRFGGLLFAGNAPAHSASVIRPEVIKNLLMALK
jgi:hypothetical protein